MLGVDINSIVHVHFKIIFIYLYTYKTLIILIVCLFEAARTFENSRAKSTCYDS